MLLKNLFKSGNANPKFGGNKGAENPMFGRKGTDNPNFGKKRSEETKMKMKLKKLGQNNPMFGTHCNVAETNGMWKGDEVGYTGIHYWIRQRLPKPQYCQICESVPPYDLANVSGRYSRDLKDWQWLCRKCHMISDGRIADLLEARFIESAKQIARERLKKDPVTGHFMKKVDI